jgi:hypothetical protein
MFKWKITLLINVLFLTYTSKAQEFGGNPSALKWNQVNTPEARIIFPQQLDSPAI